MKAQKAMQGIATFMTKTFKTSFAPSLNRPMRRKINPISKKAKAIKRIRIRGFHTGHKETGASLTGTNCTVTEVKRNETGFDRIFDLTGLSGDFYKITLVGSNTNQITGFEIIEAE